VWLILCAIYIICVYDYALFYVLFVLRVIYIKYDYDYGDYVWFILRVAGIMCDCDYVWFWLCVIVIMYAIMLDYDYMWV